MVSAARNNTDTLAAQVGYLDWVRQDSRVATRVFCVACFPEAVESPAPDVVLVVNGKGVILSRCNVFRSSTAYLDRTGLQVLLVARGEAPTELILFVSAPCPYGSLGVKSQRVIRTACDLCNV